MREDLQKSLGREPTDHELAEADNMDVQKVRKQLEVSRAARNKLIKVNAYFLLFHLLGEMHYNVCVVHENGFV